MVEDSGRTHQHVERGFPKFRMLVDGRHFYRIDDPEHFVEIQIVGTKRTVHQITASAYPEKLRVQQMIDMSDGLYAEIDAARWEDEWEATGR